MVKLFVSGFPLDISEIELVKLFNHYADVATVKIVRDKKTGTCKGYAFLEMKDLQSAERAIDGLDYAPLNDRRLTVKLVEEPAPEEAASLGAEAMIRYIKVENPALEKKAKRPRRQG